MENDLKMENKNDMNIFAELRKDWMIAMVANDCNAKLRNNILSVSLALHIYVWHDLILARSAQKQNNGNEMQSENQYYKQTQAYRHNVNV